MNYLNSLSSKIIIILLICTISVAAVVGYVSYNINRNSLIAQLHMQAEQTADRLAFNLAWPMWEYLDLQVGEIISLEMKADTVISIIVREKNGKMYRGMRKLAGGGLLELKPEDRAPEHYLKIVREIRKGGSTVLGSIELYLTDDKLYQEISRLIEFTVAQAGLLSLIIIIAIYVSFNRIIIRALQRILKTVEAVANGNLDTPKLINYSDDEIGQFIKAVNKMVENLKNAENARETLMSELSRKTVEMENIVYITSHDLRSPMINIQGFSQCLNDQCIEVKKRLDECTIDETSKNPMLEILSDKIPHYIHFIMASVKKIDTLLGGLLKLSRTGRATLSPEHINMKSMLDGIIASLNFHIQKAGATVEIGELPDCTGDCGHINQVFTNLIDNALKYLDPNKKLVIRIYGRTENENIIYTVEDTGLGILPQNQEKIWELFQRLDPKGPITGEGMGLTLVRRIISRHNGKTWVESEYGKGSRFFVSLPVA